MRACKCDRCGEFFELPNDRRHPKVWLNVSSDDGFAGSKCDQYDFCEKCSASLGEWFKQGRQEHDYNF